ncbi:MAG: hypothetical protein K2H64_01195 [Desulfovibrio sp.]|nr:hypothetical protein [Desulfovibrio sp.]
MAKLQEIIDKQVNDIIEHKSENLIIENRAHQRDKITLPEKLTQVQNLRHIFLAGVYLSNPEILSRLQTVKSIRFYEVAGVINSIEVFGGIDGLTRFCRQLQL